jgi:hypothetical protein
MFRIKGMEVNIGEDDVLKISRSEEGDGEEIWRKVQIVAQFPKVRRHFQLFFMLFEI